MSKKPEKDQPEKSQPAPTEKKTENLAEKLGFSKLDLSVEEVEERISPRETNVFDK